MLGYYIYIIISKLKFIIGKINYIRAIFWEINISKKCQFDGITYFRKTPGSSIVIGRNCRFRSRHASNHIGINRPCIISTQTKEAQIFIGNYCGFSGTVIGSFKSINIGDNVRCGANTLITDGDWHTDDKRSGESKEVIIEENVWLGINAVILKGVKIGKNTVIGANSVVTKSIPENVIAAGNPCKVIKNIN